MAELAAFFTELDVLLCPAFPEPAPQANGPYSLYSPTPFEGWLANLLNGMRYTVLANESGLPSLSLPSSTLDGLPTGVLLYGAPLTDGLLLQLAAEIEAAAPTWFNAVPPFSVSTATQPALHE